MTPDAKWKALVEWLLAARAKHCAEHYRVSELGYHTLADEESGRVIQCNAALAEMSRLSRQRPRKGKQR